jgi:capsular exopolysaccharide synthesis family protein
MNAVTLATPLTPVSRFDQSRHIGRRSVSFGALGQVLRWRWKLVAGVLALTMLLVVGASFAIPPRYQSVARLRITPNRPLVVAPDGEGGSGPLDQSLLSTEIATIRSRDIARRVVLANHLQHDPEFVSARLRNGKGEVAEARAVEAAISTLLERLAVEQQEKSYILAIGFQSRDPVKAARIANSFAESYINSTADVMMSTAARQADEGQAALQRLSRQAEVAAADVAHYRASTGIVQGANGATVNDQQIAPLTTQVATAEAQAAAARSNLETAEKQVASAGPDAVSAVLSSNVIADLRRQRTAAEADRSQLASRYGPMFPALIEGNERIAALDRQIREEQSRIIEGLRSEARAATAQAASLRGQLGSLKGEIAANNSAAVKAESLQRSADAATGAYNHLASSVQQTAQVEQSSQPQARLIEQAVVTSLPAFPNRPAMAATSVLAGLVLGVIAAMVTETMQGTVRNADDVEVLLGLRFLASVPRLGRKQLRGEDGGRCTPADTLILRPMSAYAEAYRAIRSSIRRAEGGPARVVALCSTVPGEGKTSSSLTLARVMAMAGERVLLIDGDVRRPSVRRQASLHAECGLIEVLNGEVDLAEAIIEDHVAGCSILPVAKSTFSPTDLFNPARMRSMLEQLRPHYDHILIDTPPVLGVTDARSIAKLSDGVVLMIKWGGTPIAAVDAALAGLEHDNVPIIGAVLTMVNPRAEAVGALYYSRRYVAYYER